MAVALVLLAAWVIWALAGRVSIVAVSKRARFESGSSVRQIAVPLSGRITRVQIVLGQSVRHGDVLLELDPADAAIRRGKAVADIDNLRRRIDAVTAQIAATRATAEAQKNAAAAKLQQAREAAIEAAHLADIESTGADRLEPMARQGLVPASQAADARSRANAARAKERGLKAAAVEAAKQQAEVGSTAEAALRSLDGDRIGLQTQLDAEQASLQQADVDIERSRVRAPADGRIGSSAELRAGTFVAAGTVATSIIPAESRDVAAWFSIGDMPLMRSGQRATVWLESLGRGGRRRFAATVTGIERDPSGSDFRVTLRLTAPPRRAGIEQGLPVTVTIDVLRLSPFEALLRAAGMLPAPQPAS